VRHPWHLSDTLERPDSTFRPTLGYGRSLLYLVWQACEGGTPTPLVGMETAFEEIRRLSLDNGMCHSDERPARS
jgi:hypothetical protein